MRSNGGWGADEAELGNTTVRKGWPREPEEPGTGTRVLSGEAGVHTPRGAHPDETSRAAGSPREDEAAAPARPGERFREAAERRALQAAQGLTWPTCSVASARMP